MASEGDRLGTINAAVNVDKHDHLRNGLVSRSALYVAYSDKGSRPFRHNCGLEGTEPARLERER